MANPNIINVTNIQGNTSSYVVSTTDNPFSTALVSNPADSGKVYKINTIFIANRDGENARDFTLRLYSEDDLGGSNTEIASTVSVPADSSLILIDKNSSFYLLENKSIGITCSVANTIAVTVSWEEIS
jgi:hypothetical protein